MASAAEKPFIELDSATYDIPHTVDFANLYRLLARRTEESNVRILMHKDEIHRARTIESGRAYLHIEVNGSNSVYCAIECEPNNLAPDLHGPRRSPEIIAKYLFQGLDPVRISA